MNSGAGHDAMILARQLPAALVFVPNRDGISHRSQEWTSQDELAAGADVLLNLVLELDKISDDLLSGYLS